MTVHFQLSHSVSALTVGINPITIPLLKLGAGDIFTVLISCDLGLPEWEDSAVSQYLYFLAQGLC